MDKQPMYQVYMEGVDDRLAITSDQASNVACMFSALSSMMAAKSYIDYTGQDRTVMFELDELRRKYTKIAYELRYHKDIIGLDIKDMNKDG